MNIFFRELKAHRKAIIIWSLAMVLFVFLGMQKYNTLIGPDGNNEAMLSLVNSMPKFLQAMWGMSQLDITTAIGYYGIVFSYLVLMGGIHASMLGSNIIVKEENDKTVEFLMAKPISRKMILTAKIIASLTNVIIFNLVTFGTSIIVLKGFTDEPIASQIILSMISMFFIQLIFLIIGVGAAASMKHPRKAGLITMTILIGTFFLSLIVEMSDKLTILKILTPFKYFDAKNFFISGTLNIGYIILTIAIIISVLIIAYRQYEKRDLNL